MGSLTKQEKIDLAKKQIEQSKRLLTFHRQNVQDTLNTLEMHEEYLEILTKVSDLQSSDVQSEDNGSLRRKE